MVIGPEQRFHPGWGAWARGGGLGAIGLGVLVPGAQAMGTWGDRQSVN